MKTLLSFCILHSAFCLSMAQSFSNLSINVGIPLDFAQSNGTLYVFPAPSHPVDRNILVRFGVGPSPFGEGPNAIFADAGSDETGRPSYSPLGVITNWTFAWGDGTSSDVGIFGPGDYQTHVYQTPGTYTVTLTVISAGFQNSSNKIVVVPIPPPALAASKTGTLVPINPRPNVHLIESDDLLNWRPSSIIGPPWTNPAGTNRFYRTVNQ